MKYADSEFRKLAMARESLAGELVIDAHTHTGGRSSIYHLPDASTDEVVSEMDRLGVDQAITFSFAGITSDYAHGNDVCAQAVRAYPDRFVGLAVVNPHYHTDIRDELDRCRELGLRGIKLISDYQRYPVEGPGLFPAYEYAHEHGWMILNHNWGSPAFLDKLATTFSNACFILGHYFGSSGGAPLYAEIIAKHDNVFQCTCAALNFADAETMVDTVPVEKIIFGSDMPDLPLMFSLAPILYARISDEDKRRIIGLNATAMIERWPGG